MQSQKNTVIYTKACGKVLVAGGYGVLEKNNIGLSLALENYFYCQLEQSSRNEQTHIIVESPQIHKSYVYTFKSQTSKLQEKDDQQNVFVENALFFALRYFQLLQTCGRLKITLLFDKGFISENSSHNLDDKFIVYSQNYSKTGLGSSACVVVSIVSAICSLMGQGQNKNLINVISQVANLSAQKKIGSNFDISTAVHGSHLYKNILPQIAYKCIHDQNWKEIIQTDPQIQVLPNVNQMIKDESIGFLIDVSKGANTRVMVSNFLKNLRAENEQTQKEFFEESKEITQNLCTIFQEQSEDFNQILKKMKQVNSLHRNLQQRFSKITKTPVEPLQFEGFVNELMRNQNILYVICPGSGGFDALFMLGLRKQSQKYYEQLIEATRKNYEHQLGEGVNFSLKPVDIKWNNFMNVTEQEIKQFETFLQNSKVKIQ